VRPESLCFGETSKHVYLDLGLVGNRDSDWLRAGRPTGRSSSPGRVVQTDSGAHPASYPIGPGGSFPGGKEAGA
jgi:hypothetical protein